MMHANKHSCPEARWKSTTRKRNLVQRGRRRQYAISSLLVACISCTSPCSKNLNFVEAFSSSSYSRSKHLELETALFATIEKDNLAAPYANFSADETSPISYHHNGKEIKMNGHSIESKLPKQLDEDEDKDWSPESHMEEHFGFGSLESLKHIPTNGKTKEPFYAQKITSIAVTPANEVVKKLINGATNGKNGAHLSAVPPPPKPNGEADDRDTLSGFDSLSENEEEEEDISELICIEDNTNSVVNQTATKKPEEPNRVVNISIPKPEEPSVVANPTQTKRPSKRRRVVRAARKVWGYISPVRIFKSGHEDEPTAVKKLFKKIAKTTSTAKDVASAEELKAEKQRNKEAALVERMSRKKKKQLSNLLQTANRRNTESMAGITSRTLTGLIIALAEEAEGISVRMDAQEDTPIWRKQIDSVSIEFKRLGFKPLYMGSPDQQLVSPEEEEKKEKALVEELKELKLNPPTPKQQMLEGSDEDEDDDSCPVQYTLDTDGIPMGAVSCADTAFQQIDVDNSGAVDKDELAKALVLAADSNTAAETGEGSREVIDQLAKQLVDLYDTNDDGVIDRMEYQSMVEDMAALRQVRKEREQKQEEKNNGVVAKAGTWWNNLRGNKSEDESSDEPSSIANATDGSALGAFAETALQSQEPETTGKIVLENVKVDLRQVLFGALPFVKRATPGGPLFLEPMKATVTASFTAEDIMKSTLLDAGLRQLVSFALRVRVRSLRDLADGAVFYGRKWKRDSVKAPLVQCTELISVEIDDKDRAIITGRAKVRATEDAPVIDQSFKLRTKVATPRNGRAIKLSEPEIALVLECPKQLEENINKTFAKLKMKPPSKPKPIYTYIPIHSPFKKNDDVGGYYMGEDNRLKSMYIKDKCLRFEMEAILRPGKFLGSHYLAFTVPQRALIITVDRVKEGMRAARRRKKKLKALLKARAEETDRMAHQAEDALALDEVELASAIAAEELDDGAEKDSKDPPAKGFISRFVDGYVQAGEAEGSKEKLAHAISDWFGRQGISDSKQRDGVNSATGRRTGSV